MKRTLTLIILLGVFSAAMAQRVVSVCGEYTYYVPENVTLEQARQTALQRARVEGLIKEFNQTVYQSNTTIMSNRNGESSVDMLTIGGSDVRGEWIEDSGEPKYNTNYEQGMLVVKAEICGKARKIASAGIDVQAKVLRNGTEPRHESDTFISGDDMYLWFLSPVDGYVAVYLLDRGTQTVYCLLPYRNSSLGAVEVKHDKPHLFFHQDRHLPDWQYIDEYTMTASHAVEYNEVYVVFSPNKFAKAAATASGDLAPRELPFKDFAEWLTRCKTKDPDMSVSKHLIQIKKK